MTIQFSIENPPTAEAIATARAAVERVARYRLIIKLIAWVAAFFFAKFYYYWATSIAEAFLMVNSNASIPVILVFCFGFMAVLFTPIVLVNWWIKPYETTYYLTNPIDGTNPFDEFAVQDALVLAAKFPELESYRQSVVASRPFLYGDFESMRAYADEAHKKQVARQTMEREDGYAQKLAQLNMPAHSS